MHLIGHTVGFRHEHTRPDRDIQLCEYHQSFCAEQLSWTSSCRHLEIDHQATAYDFDSIMHSPRDYFSITPGLPTTEVVNTTVFCEQGSPNIGQ